MRLMGVADGLCEALLHHDELAWNLGMEGVGQWRNFEQLVAESLVKGSQWRHAGAKSAKPDGVAVCVARKIFRDCENSGSEAFALVLGQDGEQSEVAAPIRIRFEVDTRNQDSGRIFVEQEFPARHVVADAGIVDAIMVEDRALDHESCVDHSRDRGNVVIGCDAHR